MVFIRLNVYVGFVGVYIIYDLKEKCLKLFFGEYDVLFFIIDCMINEDGFLFYLSGLENFFLLLFKFLIVLVFCGDIIFVNGKVWLYLEVELRKYCFCVINVFNMRIYNLLFDNGGEFIQIGLDGGFLLCFVKLNFFSFVFVECYDIIIDFIVYEG